MFCLHKPRRPDTKTITDESEDIGPSTSMEAVKLFKWMWLKIYRYTGRSVYRCVRLILQAAVLTFLAISTLVYVFHNVHLPQERPEKFEPTAELVKQSLPVKQEESQGEPAKRSTETESKSRLASIRVYHPNIVLDTKKLPDPKLKTILFWNRLFWLPPSVYYGTGQQPFIDSECPISDCFISDDIWNVMPPTEYDAVVFFWPQMKSTLPYTYARKPSQSYVFFNDEPPSEYMKDDLSVYNNFFNMTISYRKDSDIFWPYGTVEKISPPPAHEEPVNYALGKKKLVAWFVSNCQTRNHREEYVASLRKYVDVDIYGKCGDLECPPNYEQTGPDPCFDMLAKNYKFYLSFENTFCRDYVTEKLFKILERDIVPVVYGAVNYSAIAPPNSYIDATQLSARKLAQLLLTLDKDDYQYNKYLHSKFGYRVRRERRDTANKAFCQLCEYLHRPEKVHQTYDRFDEWWSVENHCHSSGIFRIPFKGFSFDKVDIESFQAKKIKENTEETN